MGTSSPENARGEIDKLAHINAANIRPLVDRRSVQRLAYGCCAEYAYSGPNRPLIPIETGHLFRANPAGYSGPK